MRKNLLRTSDRVLPVERQSLFFLFSGSLRLSSLPFSPVLRFPLGSLPVPERPGRCAVRPLPTRIYNPVCPWGRGLSSALPDCAVKIENASFAGQETARFFLRTILSCCTLEPDRI